MAIALVTGAHAQITGASGGGTSGAVDTSGASLTVVHISQYVVPTKITPTDSKGNTYTGLTAQASGIEAYARMWYSENPTVGTGHTFTASQAASFPTADFAAFSGVATSSSFDQQNGATGTANTLSTGSVTPSADNELVVAGLSENTAATIAINASMTIIDSAQYNAGNSEGGALAYIVQTTAGAINPQWSGFAASSSAATIATFKAVAAAATVARRLMLMGAGA